MIVPVNSSSWASRVTDMGSPSFSAVVALYEGDAMRRQNVTGSSESDDQDPMNSSTGPYSASSRSSTVAPRPSVSSTMISLAPAFQSGAGAYRVTCGPRDQ